MAPDTAPGEADEVEIRWMDEQLAVVEKPAGMIVHEAPSHSERTLVDHLEGIVGGGPAGRIGVVHRLDRDTSGLIVVGRTGEAVARLQEMIRERRVERRYLTLVEGRPRSRTGRIEAPIGRSVRQRHRMAVGGASARPAATEFEALEALASTTLLDVRLDTGRTHQIRVHMQAIGTPVVGDPQYGGRIRMGLERQFLHAYRISLTHPFSGRAIEIESELPADLASALARARRE